MFSFDNFFEDIDEAAKTDDEEKAFFGISIVLLTTPRWKLALIYLYTFLLGAKGKVYRSQMKFILVFYKLRWVFFKKRMKDRWNSFRELL